LFTFKYFGLVLVEKKRYPAQTLFCHRRLEIAMQEQPAIQSMPIMNRPLENDQDDPENGQDDTDRVIVSETTLITPATAPSVAEERSRGDSSQEIALPLLLLQ
jgi:hypothetical protein